MQVLKEYLQLRPALNCPFVPVPFELLSTFWVRWVLLFFSVFLLVLFFGISSELWPGFACGVVALGGCLAVAKGLARLGLTDGRLVLVYCVVNSILFIAFIAYMFSWRIYIYNPNA